MPRKPIDTRSPSGARRRTGVDPQRVDSVAEHIIRGRDDTDPAGHASRSDTKRPIPKDTDRDDVRID